MIRETVFTNYRLKLTASEEILLEDDWTLGGRLEKLGCFDVDWDNHFGPFIYYSVADEDDNPDLHNKVFLTCQKRVREMEKKKA